MRDALNSKAALWTGRVISILVILDFLMSAGFGIVRPPVAVQGSLAMGFPESTLLPTGVTLLVCTVLYVIPRTSVLGAILITGYLGGAVAAHVRIGSPAFDSVFAVLLGVLTWGGLYLREPRLRSLLPLKS